MFNGTASFNADTFVFASENGTITGWRGGLGTTAETLFARPGANYKGLAISADKSSLFAANFGSGAIDVFSSAGLTGSFADASLPAGYKPFNVQNLGGKLYVTFALANGGTTWPGAGHGFVKVFDAVTHTFSALVSQGALDSPWGGARAGGLRERLGGDLLVGNFGDGNNAFDPLSGLLLGTLADASLTRLVTNGLWGLTFGNGGNGGSAASLDVIAGSDGETGGLFARIDSLAVAPVPEPTDLMLMIGGLGLLACHRFRLRRA